MNSRFEIIRDWLIVGIIFLTLGVIVSFGLKMNQEVQRNNEQPFYVAAENVEVVTATPQSHPPPKNPQTNQNLDFLKFFGLVILGIILFFLLLSALGVMLYNILRKFLAHRPAH